MKLTFIPSRRDFVKNTGMLFGSSFLPYHRSIINKSPQYKMGLQLYTIRDAMAHDPMATLAQVRALGYEDGEVYGFDAGRKTYYGMSANEFSRQLKNLDFTISSGHYDFHNVLGKSEDAILEYADRCIEGSLAIGAKYISWARVLPEHHSLDGFKLLSHTLNKLGEYIRSAGLGLAYHNHGYEFAPLDNGIIPYEMILSETDPELVKMQMDMYWVVRGSARSPIEWIAEHPDRFVMWHIKDMDGTSLAYTEMGNGVIDYVDILSSVSKDALAFYYIEQGSNFAHSSMQSIADSAAYFNSVLKRFF